jgi:diguanylate cyclase (GGDEF)-like protein/PAS domain S-box-containing protein
MGHIPLRLEDALTEAPASGALRLVAQLAADLLKAKFAAVALRSASGEWLNVLIGAGPEWRDREIPLFAAAAAFPDAAFSADPPLEFPLPGARFFAAFALPSSGERIGVLAVADTEPRELSGEQHLTLRSLARIAAEAAGLREVDLVDAPPPGFDIAFSIDLSGRFIRANAAAEQVIGYSERELANYHITDLINDPDRDRFWARMAAQLGSGGSECFEAALTGKDNRRVTLQVRTRLRFARGLPVGIDACAQNLANGTTESNARVRIEAELRDKRSELALFSDHLRQLHRLSTTEYSSLAELFADYLDTGCGIFRMPTGLIVRNGPYGVEVHASRARSDAPPRELPPECLNADMTSESSQGTGPLRCWISTPIMRGSEQFGSLVFCSEKAADARLFTPHDRELIELMAKGIGRSVYERQLNEDRDRLTERLSEQVRLDPLTGLLNRVYLSEHIQSTLSRARRTNTGLAVLFIDLDRFKPINDTLGHTIGDEVLKQVAARLRAAAPSEECAGRMGGDEFTLMLPGISSREEIASVAEKLLASLRAPYIVDDFEFFLTASIGISVFPGDGGEAKELLQKADAAMYRAKSLGKNDYHFFGPDLALRTMRKLELENQLRRALDKGELQLCFQPVRRVDGALDGLEALLAWENPKFGKIGAGRFIPIAEESGMIVSIGAWVLNEACLQNARWQKQGRGATRVSINVSSLQFARPDFYDTVAAALTNSGLPPQCLELELTESMIMRDVEEAVRRMWQVRRLGVSMSIDDFGTGYSSLSYLRRLPVDSLKIDRSFVAEVTSSGSSLPLIQTIIVLAHNMGLMVVAEGVETREQLNVLRSLGCDKVQGHLFGEPMPVAAVDNLLDVDQREAAMLVSIDPSGDPGRL